MEQLLHYTWKHRLLPVCDLKTTDGQRVEVIDPGLHNQNAGPDFFNAKVKIDDTLWVGNIEIHDKASDWYAHGHDRDAAYNNVVLHVVGVADARAKTESGHWLPQMEVQVPASVSNHYKELLHEDKYPPCRRIIPMLPCLTVHSWMSALQTERLEQKTEAIDCRVQRLNGDWESAFFVTLARNFGFGINTDAFETWAMNVPLKIISHHRDNLFQIEAVFMGQAGLLDEETLSMRWRQSALDEGYFNKLRTEYRYLAHKFSLQPISVGLWRFLRLRPQNFPYIRLSQLASLYHSQRCSLSQLMEAETPEAAVDLLRTGVTPYWQTHYVFGETGRKSEKRLSQPSLNILLINTVVPMLFAYGRHLSNEKLCDRAFFFLERLKAEHNHIVTMWQECGLKVDNAGDSQALIQLKRQYCDRKDCLRCRIGYEYLRRDK